MGATQFRVEQIKTGTGITADGSHNLIADLLSTGGLAFSTNSITIKLDTNPGLVLASTGIMVLLDTNPGLVLGAGGVKIKLDTNSGLALGAGGLSVGELTTKGDLFTFSTVNARLGVGSDGQYLVADSASTNGIKWATFSGLTTSNFIFNETPTGTLNGINVTFTLANTPTAGTVRLFLNGQLLLAGVGKDYTIATATITFATAPISGDVLLASYMK